MITIKYLFANLLNFSYTFSLGFMIYIFIIFFSILFATYSKSNFLKKDYFYPENLDIFLEFLIKYLNRLSKSMQSSLCSNSQNLSKLLKFNFISKDFSNNFFNSITTDFFTSF